ncbi:hypothetical protein [Cellulomonas soli]
MSPSPAEVRTARLFVAGQGLLLVLLVVLPGDRAWPVPAWLRVVCVVAGVGGSPSWCWRGRPSAVG